VIDRPTDACCVPQRAPPESAGKAFRRGSPFSPDRRCGAHDGPAGPRRLARRAVPP